MIIGRMFDYHMLDMVELGVESYTALKEFKTAKVALGCKPALVFHGEPFSDPANAEMQRLKNILVDFWRGPSMSVNGSRVLMRSYRIHMSKSAVKAPRVD